MSERLGEINSTLLEREIEMRNNEVEVVVVQLKTEVSWTKVFAGYLEFWQNLEKPHELNSRYVFLN